DTGVAALTAQGARVASGRITRADVLAQLTVRATATPQESPAERIDLLITTDLLSEGLNLQQASVIVHLDLPWNPARLDQRVGRALRLGSPHKVVTVYTLAPPAAAERRLRIEQRLRDKLGIAQRTIGVAGRILPSPLGVPPQSSAPEHGIAEQRSAVNDQLRQWLNSRSVVPRSAEMSIAAAESTRCGFLALVRDRDGTRLVTNLGNGIETRVSSLLDAIAACNGNPATIDSDRAARVIGQLAAWLDSRAGELLVDFRAASTARSRRLALRRTAEVLARAPRHQRSVLAPLAAAVRVVATAALGEGAERILETLVQAELPDEAWLRSIATFGALNVRTRSPHASGSSEHESGAVLAVILFGRGIPAL
ncbi:MAG: C-terminal helicase domain-containing protein, partial [Gemmatimonadaceae bacterium]